MPPATRPSSLPYLTQNTTLMMPKPPFSPSFAPSCKRSLTSVRDARDICTFQTLLGQYIIGVSSVTSKCYWMSCRSSPRH
ncbi:hypothetical protein J6590_049245 [Homalodisca vitripennis]|nr:hypothetical protein J6590_049245 [Homalodisca vitripennis]